MQTETIIGLEIHVQLSTRTKLFCGCDNDSFGQNPNAHICPVCAGLPGALPVLNSAALEKALAAAAALGGKIQKFSKFDRKNYFYPDLPSGFQISQYDEPISVGGEVEFADAEDLGKSQKCGIVRVHLENDAGKLTHEKGATFADWSRAGTPLVEIVTEPDLRSAGAARSLAAEIQKIMRCTGASSAEMQKGMMRFDASISLRPLGEKRLFPRTEIKNLNSFQSLFRALGFEERRQKKLWQSGTPPKSETTVGWVDDAQKTVLLRSKESATDYRYFPEPDLPPVEISDEQIAEIEKNIPELPFEKFQKYTQKWNVPPEPALKISEDLALANFFEKVCENAKTPKTAANLILTYLLADPDWQSGKIKPEHFVEILERLDGGQISVSSVRAILDEVAKSGDSVEKIVEQKGLVQVSDLGELEKWASEVLAANPKMVDEFRAGNEKVLNFLMGQVMKTSGGAANPPQVLAILREKMG